MFCMKLELTLEVKNTIQKAFKLLKGASRRLFMASVVVQLDKGGQRLAEKELGWNRDLIRKGVRELKSGMTCVDSFSSRGCKLCEDRQPLLAADIRAIVSCLSLPSLQQFHLQIRHSTQFDQRDVERHLLVGTQLGVI